jgi:serine protease Do
MRVTAQDDLTADELALIKQVENLRISVIEKVFPSVIAIYGEDRQGGGSGVIIDPSGIALTNHHVIMGAGVSGWGGLADGKLYQWELIGTDPGGDVAVIQMKGKERWPFTPMGDSDNVNVGDWTLAMGNPFILAEDQKPTVTLGIVSGIKRYQAGAGDNQLVYGNCIQTDSSINPGNSGGPLFSMQGEVIGINGRGSFEERGRVNVGLGYAISSNQIKNFLPDLLATKLVEHGTLDANFSERDDKVLCSTIDLDSPIARKGLELEDELLEFEGIPITDAHQYTNLICTLPEDWPVELVVRKKDGTVKTLSVRLFGLPYSKPSMPPKPEKPTPDQQRQFERIEAMMKLLSAEPGTIRNKEVNQRYVQWIVEQLHAFHASSEPAENAVAILIDRVVNEAGAAEQQALTLARDGRFRVERSAGNVKEVFGFDGANYWHTVHDQTRLLTLVEAKTNPVVAQAISITSTWQTHPFAGLGHVQLDGSDKADGRNSFRMKITDPDGDWFYAWFSMYDEKGSPQVSLVKSSAVMDLDDERGGIRFRDWRNVDGFSIPFVRQQIHGLSEQVSMTMQTQSCEVKTDFPPDQFQMPQVQK